MTLLVFAFSVQARAAKATLFESMGGEHVLRTTVDRFAELLVADDRLNFTFADADMEKFKKLLFEQLCELSGGPCRYTGRDMRTSHAKLKLRTAEFNALAEDLYIALGKAGVAYRQQNRSSPRRPWSTRRTRWTRRLHRRSDRTSRIRSM
jgi:hemoglobin